MGQIEITGQKDGFILKVTQDVDLTAEGALGFAVQWATGEGLEPIPGLPIVSYTPADTAAPAAAPPAAVPPAAAPGGTPVATAPYSPPPQQAPGGWACPYHGTTKLGWYQGKPQCKVSIDLAQAGNDPTFEQWANRNPDGSIKTWKSPQGAQLVFCKEVGG